MIKKTHRFNEIANNDSFHKKYGKTNRNRTLLDREFKIAKLDVGDHTDFPFFPPPPRRIFPGDLLRISLSRREQLDYVT